jgi:4-hydroxybutyrate CoA-transferase
MDWRNEYGKKLVSVDEAAALIKSNDTVGVPISDSSPIEILNAVAARYLELENVTIFTGLAPLLNHMDGKCKGHIQHKSFFLHLFERPFLPMGNIEMIPMQFSHINYLLSEEVKCNKVIMECSPPDENGYLSFGPTGGMFNDFLIKSKPEMIIVQVNSKTPHVMGTQMHIHVSHVDYFCEVKRPLIFEFFGVNQGEITGVDRRIAAHITPFIKDGDTLQIGIGRIGDGIGEALFDRNDLGIHTEMMSLSMARLARAGVVTGRRKTFHPGKIITAFSFGDPEFYEFISNNSMVEFWPLPYVNDPMNIGKNDNLISVNQALAVDLTGQVCSESIGHAQYSGTGGQVDFVRGARLSKGGKSFIALNSISEKNGKRVNRIPCSLPPGSIVTTLRTDVQYIVTEHGVADLRYKTIGERVKSMINIAHPDFRTLLEEEAKQNGLLRAA